MPIWPGSCSSPCTAPACGGLREGAAPPMPTHRGTVATDPLPGRRANSFLPQTDFWQHLRLGRAPSPQSGNSMALANVDARLCSERDWPCHGTLPTWPPGTQAGGTEGTQVRNARRHQGGGGGPSLSFPTPWKATDTNRGGGMGSRGEGHLGCASGSSASKSFRLPAPGLLLGSLREGQKRLSCAGLLSIPA